MTMMSSSYSSPQDVVSSSSGRMGGSIQVENSRCSTIGSALRRVVYGTARRVRLDKLGRVQVPQVLRKYAGLEGKCLVMGQGNLMQIWALGVWESTHGPEAYEDFDLSAFDL